jgi:hypothetical protein
MELHERGDELREMFGGNIAHNALAPTCPIFCRAQVLPLMRRNIFEGIAGRAKCKLRRWLPRAFAEAEAVYPQRKD